MGAIADANRTYKNVTLAYKPGQAGTAGEGTVRAHIQTADVLGVETITNIEIIDGGKNFANNEILVIPAGNGNIAGDELTITGVLNGDLSVGYFKSEFDDPQLTGIDGWSWDAPFVFTAKKYAETKDASLIWEGHKAGRHIGYCHIEKLHNLEQLPSSGFMVSCFPVKIERASAGWTRAVAILDG